jgi:hypothetical protein
MIWAKEMMDFLMKYFFQTCRVVSHAIKSYDLRLPALLPFRSKECCGFLYSPYEFISSAWLDRTKLGSNGKHAKHYTTEATGRDRSYLFVTDSTELVVSHSLYLMTETDPVS